MNIFALLLLPSVGPSSSQYPLLIVLSHARHRSPSLLSRRTTCISVVLSSFFYLQFVQSCICWKEALSFLGWGGGGGLVGPRLLIACWQWPLYPAIKSERAYRGDLKAQAGVWKVILGKELETIIVSMESWGNGLFSGNKSTLKLVLMLVDFGFELQPYWSVQFF